MAGTPTIRKLRRALLLLILLLVAGLVGLYWFGRSGHQPIPRASRNAAEPLDPTTEFAIEAEGFDYELEEEGQTIFRLQGEKYRVDQAETVYLDELTMTVLADTGETYRLTSDRGVYRQDNESAFFDGNVRLRGEDGIELTTSELELQGRGSVVVGKKPVRFRYGDQAAGGGDRLRANLKTGMFVLLGNVTLESTEQTEVPFALATSRATFQRDEHRVLLQGGVEARFGPHRMQAVRLNIFLSDDNRRPKYIRALWMVLGLIGGPSTGGEAAAEAGPEPQAGTVAATTTVAPDDAGEGAGDPATGPIAFDGRALSVLFTPEGDAIHRLEIEGPRRGPARLITRAADGRGRRLLAGYLVGELDGGQLATAEAFGGVLLETVPDDPLTEVEEQLAAGLLTRRDQGEGEPTEAGEEMADAEEVERLELFLADEPPEEEAEGVAEEAGSEAEPAIDRAWLVASPSAEAVVVAERAGAVFLPDGVASTATFYEGVKLSDRDLEASADEATVDLVEETVDLVGRPATASSSQGRISAPRLAYTGSDGALRGEGGARTELVDSAAAAGSLAGSPLASGDGPVLVESTSAVLHERFRTFEFSGGVRAWQGESLLLADRLDGEGEPASGGGGVVRARGAVRTTFRPSPGSGRGLDADNTPVEVEAGEMDYDQRQSRLVYRDSVDAKQGGRRIAAARVTVELDDTGAARTMICEGGVEIDDRTARRSVSGERARYEISGRTVEVDGDPVTLRDADGTELAGRHLTYEFESGIFEMQGRPSASAVETPSEPAPEPR